MTSLHQMRTARKYLKKYAPAVIAAELMFGGVRTFISTLKYPIADGLLRIINTIIRNGFRGQMLLQEYYGTPPWWYHVGIAAEGAIMMTLGILVGLWASFREQRPAVPGA